jgi:hypothetical protein
MPTFAEDGRGIAWLPYSLAAQSLTAGRLVLAAAEARWTTPVDIVLFPPGRAAAAGGGGLLGRHPPFITL